MGVDGKRLGSGACRADVRSRLLRSAWLRWPVCLRRRRQCRPAAVLRWAPLEPLGGPISLSTAGTTPLSLASSETESLAVWAHFPGYTLEAARIRDDGTVLDPDGIAWSVKVANHGLSTVWTGTEYFTFFPSYDDGGIQVVRAGADGVASDAGPE